MQNFRFDIAFDGTRYYGWERQPNVETVQGKIETCLSRIIGHKIELIGAGRTDAGVHAKDMVANALIETELTCDEIRDKLNLYLPDDICILKVTTVDERFHARFNAKAKLYVYTCYIGKIKPIYDRKYVTKLDFIPDLERMKCGAEYLTGVHDFKSFTSNPYFKRSTVRNVDRIRIEREGDLIRFSFHGDGFLRSMVRIMVGTLLEIGQGILAPEQLPEILSARDRTKAGPTAPAQGLTLERVEY